MKKLFYFLLPVILFILGACEKEDDLPKPTQTGADIMAAKVNGKIWQSRSCWTCIGGGSGLDVEYSSGYLRISGEQGDEGTFISLEVQDVKGSGSYTLKDKSLSGIFGKNGTYGRVFISQGSKYYETTATSTGTVTKLDVANKIISGTFSFRAQNEENSSEFVEVTDGRFDVKYG